MWTSKGGVSAGIFRAPPASSKTDSSSAELSREQGMLLPQLCCPPLFLLVTLPHKRQEVRALSSSFSLSPDS